MKKTGVKPTSTNRNKIVYFKAILSLVKVDSVFQLIFFGKGSCNFSGGSHKSRSTWLTAAAALCRTYGVGRGWGDQTFPSNIVFVKYNVAKQTMFDQTPDKVSPQNHFCVLLLS